MGPSNEAHMIKLNGVGVKKAWSGPVGVSCIFKMNARMLSNGSIFGDFYMKSCVSTFLFAGVLSLVLGFSSNAYAGGGSCGGGKGTCQCSEGCAEGKECKGKCQGKCEEKCTCDECKEGKECSCDGHKHKDGEHAKHNKEHGGQEQNTDSKGK